MGQKLIRFSDLSGKTVDDDSQLVRIVVREHPDLDGGPVELEALAEELTGVEEVALDLVSFELHHPGEDEPETFVMEVAAFNKLAADTPMAEVLQSAKRVVAAVPSQARPAGSEKARINYASLEHAGKPHKGRTTDAENGRPGALGRGEPAPGGRRSAHDRSWQPGSRHTVWP
ncbi:hypothetical protein G3I60_20150 [Streptomyces sp. SID13666]|uniref:hypothetical protein n=1 Tax=Streptomyces sp. SID13666 TaxID=2706054 RepID=UPI0013BFA5D2|nr:hypothetical protein [Streptomyces sp. SID13666]NEA56394.1 hypothetical protein [Streptomyces sp. SID13666]